MLFYRDHIPNMLSRYQIKDLQAAKTKTPYKTVAEIDAQVKYAFFFLCIYSALIKLHSGILRSRSNPET